MSTSSMRIIILSSTIALYAQECLAAPTQNPNHSSLCQQDEVVLFSCDTGSKKISLCGSNNDLAQYRFGKTKQMIELAYPAQPAPLLTTFNFTTDYVTNSANENVAYNNIISFHRPGASYRIIIPQDLKNNLTAATLEVEINGKPTTVLNCEKESVSTGNLAQHIEIFKPHNFKEMPDIEPSDDDTSGIDGICSVSYPVLPNPILANAVKSLLNKGECNPYQRTDGRLIATFPHKNYINLTYYWYQFGSGAAHGENREATAILKNENGWKKINKSDLFTSSAECKDKLNALLYNQLATQVTEVKNELDPIRSKLFDIATIEMKYNGINFIYNTYDIGSYSDGSFTAFVSNAGLGKCLRLPTE